MIAGFFNANSVLDRSEVYRKDGNFITTLLQPQQEPKFGQGAKKSNKDV